MASQVKFPDVESNRTAGFDGAPIETSSEKLWRKLREQPLVPLGCLATCGALIAASHYLRTGNRDQFQKALRWRVGLQGVTVVAAVAGTIYMGSGTPASTGNDGIATVPGRPATVSQAAQADERRQFERAQLFERLREAELREEYEQKQRAEALLLRTSSGSGGGASASSSSSSANVQRARSTIGKDRRDRSAPSSSDMTPDGAAAAPSLPPPAATQSDARLDAAAATDKRRLV